MGDRARRIGAFVGIVALVVLGAVVAGLIAADAPAEPTDATVENEYYTSEALLEEAELEARSGEIDLAEGPSRTVLIASDRPRDDLEPLVEALVTHGHEVRFFDEGGDAAPPGAVVAGAGVQPTPPSQPAADGELTAELEDVDALLVVGDPQLERADVDGVEEFVDAGGRLVVATDSMAADPFGFVAGGGDADSLLDRFGVTLGEGYLYNMAENDANFQRVYADGADGELAEDVDRVVLDGASPVWTDDGTSIATATDGTQYSTTREDDTFDVAVRNDDVVVVGDTDVIRPLNYNRADNERLLGNVLEFLTDGPEDPFTIPEEEPPEEFPEEPPEEFPEEPPEEDIAEEPPEQEASD